ncbi:MAG: pyruvate formate lyase family protein [Bacillota bacterium]|nr:pyruvate formate lyase family protein [Bacillota bacterium]
MLPQRIQKLRAIIMRLEEIKKYVPRQVITYEPDESKSPILRHAEAYAQVLSRVSVNHLPGELIVGNNLDKFSPRPGHLTESELRKIRDYPRQCPAELLAAMREEIFYLWAWSDGHILPGYEKVLKLGVSGVIDELLSRLEDPGLDGEQREFIEAALIEWNAVLSYVDRHYRHFLELALGAADPKGREYLLDLARICTRVPRNPASSFREALQSIWFTFIAAQFDDCSNHSLGRLDQYLYPYYSHDISTGVLDAEHARELFLEFWLKFNLGYRLQEMERIRVEGKGVGGALDVEDGLSWLVLRAIDDTHPDIGQTIDICGLDENGEDATNELSWLIIDAVDELRTFEPKPVVKFTDKTNKDLLRKCYAINATGFGLPSFSFHEAGAKGLRRYDGLFDEQDILNHSHIGCVEVGIPGKSYTDPMNAFINLPKVVLITLNNGYYNGSKVGLELKAADTWEEFSDNFYRQLRYFVSLYAAGMNECYPFYSQWFHRPLVSTLIDGCVEKAVPVDRGGAKYWVKGVNCTGFATAVDSLYSVKSVVFEQRKLSLDEFAELLAPDYADHEYLRQEIKNRIPKYGNGHAEVDSLAREVAERYCSVVRECRTFNGGRYRPGLYSFYGPVKTMGKVTGATPDGRKAGQVLSLNGAPSHGSIRNGLSGALESMTAVDHSQFDNAAAVDVQLSQGVPPEVIGYIVEYLSTKGILYVQFSVVSRDELVKAQRTPELYQDLVVRVTGFSARFVSLSKETQDEIINRSWWS